MHTTVNEGKAAQWMAVILVLTLTLQIWISMLLQQDPTLSVTDRAIGIVVNTMAAASTLWIHRDIVSGTGRTASNPWVVWFVISAPTLALGFSDAWTLLAVSHPVAWLLFPPRRAGLISGILGLIQATTLTVASQTHPVEVAGLVLITAVLAAIFYVLTRLTVVLRDYARAREHLARVSVDHDRERISRELHDVLGRTLVGVSLRQQAASRLLERDPVAARTQLEETNRMLREGQAELRKLINGETVVSLASELHAAHGLVSRLNVDIETPQNAVPDLEPRLDHLAGRIVRETVTNMLKHSRPRHVQIQVRTESSSVVMVVVNDGVVPHSGSSTGTGLSDLAQRVEDAGGTLEADHVEPDRFRVLVRLPRAGVSRLPTATTDPDTAETAPEPQAHPDQKVLS